MLYSKTILYSTFSLVLAINTTLSGQSELTYPSYKPKLDLLDNVYCYSLEIDSLQRKWIATSEGMYLFDGYELIDKKTIPKGEILRTLMDSQGYIWLSYFDGRIIRFNPYTEESKQWAKFSSFSTYITQIGNTITSQSKHNGRFTFDLEKCQISAKGFRNEKINNNLTYEDESYALHNMGIYNKKKDQYISFKLNAKKGMNDFTSINDTLVIVSNSKGLWKCDFDNLLIEKYLTFSEKEAKNVIFVQDDGVNILAGTYDGLYEIDSRTKNYTKIIEGIAVTSARVTKGNNLWCTTMNDGIRMIRRGEVKVIKTTSGTPFKVIDSSSDKVVFGGKQGKLGSYSISKGQTSFFEVPSKRWTFNDCRDIFIGKQGVVVGTMEMTTLFDSEYNLKYYKDNAPKSVYLDGDEKIAIAMRSSVWIVDLGNTSDRIYKLRSNMLYRKILDFENNEIVALTNKGLFRCFPIEQRRELIYADTSYISDALLLENGEIGMLLEGNKLVILNLNGIYSEYQLSKSENFISIKHFDDTFFFTTTTEIIGYRLNGEKINKAYTCNFLDGLYTNEISEISFWENTIYAATDNGIYSIPLNINRPKLSKPNLSWEMLAGSNSINNFSITSEEEILMNYDNSYLKLEVKNTGFSNQQDLRYSYVASGALKLNRSTPSNEIEFISFPEGKTMLNIRTWYKGEQASEPLSFSINVQGPYWRSPLFVFALGILIASILFFFLRNKRRRTILSLAIEQEKLRALRSQMNPHFVFNSLNSIQHYIIENQTKQALKYLSTFSRLIRKQLEQSDEEYHTVQQEFEFLEEYLSLENNRLKNKFDFTFELEPSMDKKVVKMPTFILQPFIENAIWHGISKLPEDRRGKIVVRMKWNKTDIIECSISDNGVGFSDKEILQSGIGIKKTQERLKMLSGNQSGLGEINFIQNRNHGITVSFLMPTYYADN